MNTKVSLILDKVGTVLGDRRFWVYVLSVAGMFGLVPKAADTEVLSKDIAEAIVLIFQAATLLGGALFVIGSWERRPPSGLRFKELLDTVSKLEQLLSEAGISLD